MCLTKSDGTQANCDWLTQKHALFFTETTGSVTIN